MFFLSETTKSERDRNRVKKNRVGRFFLFQLGIELGLSPYNFNPEISGSVFYLGKTYPELTPKKKPATFGLDFRAQP